MTDFRSDSAINASVMSNVNGTAVQRGTYQAGTPSISISDVTMNEGNSGSTIFGFVVSITEYSASNVTFEVSTSDGGASSTSDYLAKSYEPVTIYSGDLSTIVNVQVYGDNLYENSETFSAYLTNIIGASAGDTVAQGTITNDDDPPDIYIDDSFATAESGTHDFDVCLGGLSGLDASVQYATAHGTTNASDFTAKSGTVTVPAGQYCAPISISITADTLYEDQETYYVNISSPSGATIIDSQGVGTINNNDSAPLVSLTDVSITEGSNGTVTVSIPSASGLDVDFDYGMWDDDAVGGIDYTIAMGSGTIVAGSTSTTISVSTLSDTLYEGNERFEVYLSSITDGSSGDTSAWVTILDNDPAPTISVSNETIYEGSDAYFTISLSEASDVDVIFDYETLNGTATAPSDYVSSTGSDLVIYAGETSTEIIIFTNSDAVDEVDETFTLRLYNISGATAGVATGTGTITKPGLSISNVEITEGNTATFYVSLNSPTGLPVSFNYSTADGTAVAPGDYVPVIGGSGTILAGDNNTTITVNTTEDFAFEFDESFVVNLSNPVNAAITDGQATATIKDDDATADLSVSITDSPDPIVAGDNIAYNILLLNSGPNPATLVSYNQTLAPGTTFVSLSSGGFSCTTPAVGMNGTIYCTIPALEFGYSGGMTLVVKTDTDLVSGTLISQTGSISSSSFDPVSANNSATVSTSVNSLPLVTTQAASSITAQSATLNGTVNPLGTDTAVSFNYGPTISYGSEVNLSGLHSGSTILPFSTVITGLSPDTTYHFRIVAQNIYGLTNGNDLTFTTDSLGISINDVTQTEGNSGTSMYTFSVSLTDPAPPGGVTFDIATADNTATLADSDYVAKSLTGQTIPQGSTTYTFDVSVNGDNVAETNETFFVNITNVVGANVSDGQGQGTIINNDSAGITVNPTSGLETTESGGTATFSVVLNSQPIDIVEISLVSDDVGEGTVLPIALSFTSSNWFTPQTVTITGVDDSLDDGDQGYTILTGVLPNGDITYRSLNPADVSVTNLDDDGSAAEIDIEIHDAAHTIINSAAMDELVHARAMVTGNNLIPPTGTVNFVVFPNVSCTGTGTEETGVTLTSGSAEMSTTTAMTVNGLSYRVRYNGDNLYPVAVSECRSITSSIYPTVLLDSVFTIPANSSVLPQGISSLQIQFSQDVLHNNNSDPNSATNPANYLLVEAGLNKTIDTQNCDIGLAPDDRQITINTISYDSATFQATLHINNATRLTTGTYQLFACGTTSISSADGNVFLNNHLADSILTFSVRAASSGKKSVATGFTPGIVTRLPEQSDALTYQQADLWIEIPSIGVRQAIVGIPESENGWDVTWLGDDIGYLQGTAFPTWSGNSVLTGHVTGADGLPGVFADLGALRYGDEIIIHAFGKQSVYQVQTVDLWSKPDLTRVIEKHEELPWLTLITCKGYDEESGQYRWRTVLRAILVELR